METKDVWDLSIKSAALLGAAIAFVKGLWEYKDTKRKEFYEEFWNKRLAIYAQASEAAARIARSSSLEEARQARQSFWVLYSGPMSIVEDLETKRAMEKFGGALEQAEAGARSIDSLKDDAYELSTSLRDSLNRTWSRPFVI